MDRVEPGFDIVSSVVLPLSDIDDFLDDVEIGYKIRQDNEDKRNYLIGFRYE